MDALTNSTVSLRAVRSLLTGADQKPARYRIPAYQRGYRWTRTQVTQLLDDIWDFVQEQEGANRSRFYCLQPLVVRVMDDGVIEVVDGQQRLTTIHIILTCLRKMAEVLTENFFTLTFETRDDAARPPLDHIDLDREMENIDYYHICQAYRAVQDWCKEENHSRPQQFKLVQHLLNDDKVGGNVKVIWFELDKNDKPVDAFTRLNVGKIPLTNDELIRALFLGRGGQLGAEDDPIKAQVAYEWDLIEKELHARDFWGFLTDDAREQNRIGFLFEILASADDLALEDNSDEYKVFHHFNKRLSTSTRKAEWLRIKQEFMRLQEWFEDERRITFHIIGFLVTQSVKISEIRELSEDTKKSEFDRKLRDRVYQCVVGAPAVPPEQELRDKLAAYLDGLEYGRDSKKIRAILLLFNIATLLEHNRSNMRFQFDAFKAGEWDLEHIRSVASDKITNQQAWINDCRAFLETEADVQAKALVMEIGKRLPPGGTGISEEEFEALRKSILKYLGESEEADERNDLANLTLLDSRVNRSYKNAPFAVKRQKVLSLDKAGIFVPLCTRNVFLKCYSKEAGNPVYWADKDADDYQNAMIETLVGFFLGREAE